MKRAISGANHRPIMAMRQAQESAISILLQEAPKMTSPSKHKASELGLLSIDEIIIALVEALNPIDFVQAFWEGGAELALLLVLSP
jgi:hypothetical protein